MSIIKMKTYCILGLICVQLVLISCKTFYLKPNLNPRNCKFTGYVPGGKVVDVTKINAPTAVLARKATSSIMGPVSQASTLAMHSLNLVTKLSDVFSKVSPALGPALGVFGAVTGILKSISEPKPSDILNAVNTAIGTLTKDMNDKLDDMKGYVDGQIITTEKELIDRQYRSKFNLLTHCVSEPSKDLSNECQRDTYKDIGSSLPQFAVFDSQLLGGHALTVMQAKKLEAYLVPFRNYADLVMLSLVPLVKYYKDDKSAIGQGYYKKYCTELETKAQMFIKYAKAAVKAIEDMRRGPDGAGACSASFECGSMHALWEGVTWFKKHTCDHSDCSCVLDDSTKQRCTIKTYVRVDGKSWEKKLSYPVGSTTDALKRNAKETLVNLHAKPFVNQLEKVVAAYWKVELLDFIPAWEEAIKLAEPGTKVKDAEVPLSDEYSPRYKYRLQFARMYSGFY